MHRLWLIFLLVAFARNALAQPPKPTAKRRGVAGKNEVWVFPIPPQPVLATNIFATGFDTDGNAVGTKSLRYNGATDLYEGLSGKSQKGNFTAKLTHNPRLYTLAA